uniref:Uncharacterized protein n=1 Tax=Anguilla anguilla TaxID=7936 RepID=A0A0E9ULD5_ANGAN
MPSQRIMVCYRLFKRLNQRSAGKIERSFVCQISNRPFLLFLHLPTI